MRRAIIAVVLIGCLFQPAALVAQSSEFDPGKIQVLILTGLGGHAWRETTPLLREMLENTGRFEVRVMEEFRGAGPETLAPYDVVILNMIRATSGGDTIYDVKTPRWWGERAERAFLDFVRSGKGVVHRHISLAAFDGWTEFEQMSGGNSKRKSAPRSNDAVAKSNSAPKSPKKSPPPPNCSSCTSAWSNWFGINSATTTPNSYNTTPP